MGADSALMMLVRAIALGERAQASKLLADAPELALARIGPEEQSLVPEVRHQVYSGDTALHVAAAAYDAAIVRDLVGAGAPVRAANRRGAEPLHYAVDGTPGSARWDPAAQRETVLSLIALGADPNAFDKNGTAPLHRAVRNRCAAAVQALLAAGADPCAVSGKGSTPMALAHWTTGRGGSGSAQAKAQRAQIVEMLQARTQATGDQVRAAMSRRETFSPPPADVQVRETHTSWVFLAGDFAYKLKKPLVLDFLDYGTPARRRVMCEEEVRLNRRLAPGLYLGVRGVAMQGDRAELTDADAAGVVDFVVEMRRYDEGATLAARLARGELARGEVSAVGRALARFHADARQVTDVAAPVLAVERQFERNLHELLACIDQRGEIGRALALERFAHAFIAGRGATLQRRAAAGRVREGHGDLRAEHVLVGDGVQIVDCVEFDRQLRELDVADDLAFLVFDLTAHGGQHFVNGLVQAYRDAGGDPGDDQLIAFYAAYRALVRAKVALVRAAQLPGGSAERGAESAWARELIAVAERFAWRARLPLVVIACGLPASGKSHLSVALAEASGLPHISSDVTRKRLAGLRGPERAGAETYSAEWNARTHAELARRVDKAIACAGGAIVDATFRHRADRRVFTSALRTDTPQLFIECVAPLSVRVQRARARTEDRGRISDADAAVVIDERESWDVLDEVPAGRHLAVRTDRPLASIVGDVLALLDRRLEPVA